MNGKNTDENQIRKLKQGASIAIVMGSDSDWTIMKGAKDICDEFQVTTLVEVLSAHRTPRDLHYFTKNAEESEIKIIIAGAGGAAHLPGMLASHTIIPVIGVPLNRTSLNGIDSLLSIVQMPRGIPVAVVAIDQATNAGLLALQILALGDENLKKQLQIYRQTMERDSRKKTINLI